MHNGNKITAPISLHGDVYPVLGIAPSGAMYDVAEACTSSKVNGWSKVKPVRFDTPQELTDAQRKSIGYGIKMNAKTDVYELFTQEEWVYERPILGTHWCRLTDFDGYYQNAVAPVTAEFPADNFVVNGETVVGSLGYTANAVITPIIKFNSSVSYYDSQLCVSFTDIITDNNILNNYYPVIVLRYLVNAAYHYAVSRMDRPIGSINGGVVEYFNIDLGQIPELADAPTGTTIDIALAMTQIDDINTMEAYKVYIDRPLHNYISLNCGATYRKTYTLTNKKITPTYSMLVTYTRTTSGSGYKYTIDSIKLTNTNNGKSGLVTLTAGFSGQNVTSVTGRSMGSVSVSSGESATLKPSGSVNTFYTTATSNVLAELVISATWNKVDGGTTTKNAVLRFGGTCPNSGTFES